MYPDGHERDDVLAYRPRLSSILGKADDGLSYKNKMEIYTGADEGIVTPPSLPPGQKADSHNYMEHLC